MDPIERYNKLLLNTVMEDYNNITRSKLIKKLLESEIASKKKKDVDAVYIVSIAQKEKFRQCLEKNRNTIKEIELLEINKGYKYSIPYKIYNVNFEKLSEFAINIEKYNWNEFKEEDISKPVYIDNENICEMCIRDRSLANYIKSGVINPKTNNPFCIEDIKKEEYIEPVKMKIEEMGGI